MVGPVRPTALLLVVRSFGSFSALCAQPPNERAPYTYVYALVAKLSRNMTHTWKCQPYLPRPASSRLPRNMDSRQLLQGNEPVASDNAGRASKMHDVAETKNSYEERQGCLVIPLPMR